MEGNPQAFQLRLLPENVQNFSSFNWSYYIGKKYSKLFNFLYFLKLLFARCSENVIMYLVDFIFLDTFSN